MESEIKAKSTHHKKNPHSSMLSREQVDYELEHNK